MLTYAHVCSRMLTYAGELLGLEQQLRDAIDKADRLKLTYADVC